MRAFLVAFLDVLYTARQRRASSVFGGEQGPPFSPTGASFSAGASSSLSRRHLRSIHPNLPAVDEVLETPSSFVLLTKHFPRTLAAYLRTGSMRSESDEAKLFVLYQCLQCLHFLHERGMVHGNLKTRNVMVTGNQWVYLTGLQCPAVPPPIDTAHSQQDSALMRWSATPSHSHTAAHAASDTCDMGRTDACRVLWLCPGCAATSATSTTSWSSTASSALHHHPLHLSPPLCSGSGADHASALPVCRPGVKRVPRTLRIIRSSRG